MNDLLGGTVGVLGKSPIQGDFHHVRASHPAFVRFDEWLASSFEWAVAQRGPRFLESYAGGSIHAFVFHPPGKDSSLVTGALGPSRDSAGRQFPLVLASMLSLGPDLVRSPHLLPLLLEEFWAAAGDLVAEAAFRPTFDLDQRSGALSITPELDVELALSSYGAWTHDLSLQELWHLLGHDAFSNEPERPLRFLAEAVRPLARVEQPTSPLTLRLPLGQAGGAALCFWLDLTRRLLSWRATVPSFFWSHDGQAGGLILHLGQAPVSTLSEMWLPSGERDEVCDLTASLAGDWVSALPPLSPALRATLESANASVADLLAAADSA